MKTVGQRILKLLGGQAYFSQGPCDLWSCDIKIKRGHILIMTNLNTKYEDCGSKEFLVKSDRQAYKPIQVYPPYNFVVQGYKK
jgi:hypothetical protein